MVPLTWDQFTKDLLPDSTQSYLRKQNSIYERHYDLAKKYVATRQDCYADIAVEGGLDPEQFRHAWLLVNSRCIYQELSSTSTRDDNYACAPLIDMINHVPSVQDHCKLSYDHKGLSVISTSYYEAGDEVHITYGAHSNEALVCEYGFRIADNPDDSLCLDALFTPHLQPHQVLLLMEIDFWEDYSLDSTGRCCFRTEVALRAAALTENDCMEQSVECRKLMHFVNGRSDGADQEEQARSLLRIVLDEQSVEALSKLETLKAHAQSDVIELITGLWIDRLSIAERGLAYLNRT